MKKTKLKIRKQVWIVGIVVLFLAIGIYAGTKIYKDIKYRETTEYKLLEKGYTLEEISFLKENLEDERFNNLINEEKNEFLISLLHEDYYLKKNLERYLVFYQLHKDYEPDKIVKYVNTNNDYDKYDHPIDTDLEQGFLLIVNKFYHLSEDYEPSDLVSVNNKYYYGENHKLRKVAYDAFIDMWNEAYKEGIYLIMNSSYRTYESQMKVYDDYKNTRGTSYADTIAARPGYSEHQTGLALDIFSKSNTTTSNFKDSAAHIWLTNNAYKFGFIQRYHEDTVDITGFKEESWHWRYVGVEAATYIHEHNITFEEYYAYFVEK